MDINEIRALSDTDLQAALVDAKQELWKIRFDLATRQEKNYSRLPATRQRIARILTVMTERRRADGHANGDAVLSGARAGTAARASAGTAAESAETSDSATEKGS
jgi:large subunit ribosomal protein L29